MRHRPSRILRYAVLSSKKVTYQKVEPVGDSIRIWVAGNGEIDAGKLSEMLPRLLGPTALCPPESELVANSTLRAFVRYGRRAVDPSPTTMVHILAGVLGLLN